MELFSGFVFLGGFFPPSLVCLVWFGLEGLRENLGKGSTSWAPFKPLSQGQSQRGRLRAPTPPAVVQTGLTRTAGETPPEGGKEAEKPPESTSAILED